MTWGTSIWVTQMTETRLSLLKKKGEFMSSHEKPNSDKGRSGADLSEDRDMGVKFFQISSDPCPTACFCLRRTARTAQGAWEKVARWRGVIFKTRIYFLSWPLIYLVFLSKLDHLYFSRNFLFHVFSYIVTQSRSQYSLMSLKTSNCTFLSFLILDICAFILLFLD